VDVLVTIALGFAISHSLFAVLSFAHLSVSGSGRTWFEKGSHLPEIFCILENHPPGFRFHREWSNNMLSLHLHTFARWFFQFESYGPAIMVTVGAALLLACGIGATCSPCEEKDEVFHRQVF
jgi:hypothetical protein